MQLERHLWNRSFTWVPRRGPFRRITDAQARAYDERGFFVLENAFDAATINAVIEAIDPFEQQTMEFLRTQPGEKFLIADKQARRWRRRQVPSSPRIFLAAFPRAAPTALRL